MLKQATACISTPHGTPCLPPPCTSLSACVLPLESLCPGKTKLLTEGTLTHPRNACRLHALQHALATLAPFAAEKAKLQETAEERKAARIEKRKQEEAEREEKRKQEEAAAKAAAEAEAAAKAAAEAEAAAQAGAAEGEAAAAAEGEAANSEQADGEKEVGGKSVGVSGSCILFSFFSGMCVVHACMCTCANCHLFFWLIAVCYCCCCRRCWLVIA